MAKADSRGYSRTRDVLLALSGGVGWFLVRERAALPTHVIVGAGVTLAVAGSLLAIRRGWRERGLLLAVLLAAGLAPFGLFRVEGNSMDPTLLPGDIVVATQLVGELRQGDVVVLESPEWRGVFLVKRLTGLPGEWISQGHPVQPGQRVAAAPRRLESGRYMVVGDNAGHSRDGRHFGPVPRRLIVARVVVRLTPWPRIVPAGGIALRRLTTSPMFGFIVRVSAA